MSETAEIGHNSAMVANAKDQLRDQLRSIVERVERLEEEKQAISSDIKDVFVEAKSQGYDVKALREIVRRRKQDRDALEEHDAIVQTYLVALGMA